MAPDELHIASMVVHAAPRRLQAVLGAIDAMPGAQIHASSPKGKIVVTLETNTSEAMTTGVSGIQRIDGVLSAALVYQCADSLQAMNEEMSDA